MPENSGLAGAKNSVLKRHEGQIGIRHLGDVEGLHAVRQHQVRHRGQRLGGKLRHAQGREEVVGDIHVIEHADFAEGVFGFLVRARCLREVTIGVGHGLLLQLAHVHREVEARDADGLGLLGIHAVERLHRGVCERRFPGAHGKRDVRESGRSHRIAGVHLGCAGEPDSVVHREALAGLGVDEHDRNVRNTHEALAGHHHPREARPRRRGVDGEAGVAALGREPRSLAGIGEGGALGDRRGGVRQRVLHAHDGEGRRAILLQHDAGTAKQDGHAVLRLGETDNAGATHVRGDGLVGEARGFRVGRHGGARDGSCVLAGGLREGAADNLRRRGRSRRREQEQGKESKPTSKCA